MSKHRWMWKINKSVKTLSSPSNQNMPRNFNGRSIFMYGLFNIAPSNDETKFCHQRHHYRGYLPFSKSNGLRAQLTQVPVKNIPYWSIELIAHAVWLVRK